MSEYECLSLHTKADRIAFDLQNFLQIIINCIEDLEEIRNLKKWLFVTDLKINDIIFI